MTLVTVETITGRPDPDGQILGDDQADTLTRTRAISPHATARSVLHAVLQHSGAEPSTHQTITTEHDQ